MSQFDGFLDFVAKVQKMETQGEISTRLVGIGTALRAIVPKSGRKRGSETGRKGAQEEIAAAWLVDRIELTPRERECLQWAAAGKSEWEISQILGISEHTAEKHLLNAKTKLGAVNRVHAVAEGIRRGHIS